MRRSIVSNSCMRRLCRSLATAASTGPAANPSSNLPLAGIRVLDMTRVLAGPYCTQILGDLGAEVIKIEHPTRGDDTRAWGPPYAKYKPESERSGPGESAYFLSVRRTSPFPPLQRCPLYSSIIAHPSIQVNRNKKSLALSFASPPGQSILRSLAQRCDILVENFLPNTLARYSLSYPDLSSLNPSLIYASITGYGQTGPYSNRAGYDVMVEAEMGLMHITGERDGSPVKVGVAVTDLTTGLYTSNAIMAALIQRATNKGKGQHIDVSLSDCQVASLSNLASSCLISGERDTGRWGTAHPSIVPYRGFQTKDGDVLLGGGNDRLFGLLCDKLGKPEWKDEDRFRTNAARVANRIQLEGLIEAETRTKTTGEWLRVLEGSGMPYAAVNDVQDTLRHPHVLARDMVKEVDHSACGPIKLVNTPVKYSEAEPGIRSPPPMLGQHTDEVLKGVLDMGNEEIAKLKEEGVIS